jgi:hypothetical protein
MPASEAQIRSNKANSLKSCGPRTPEGRAAASANSLKHGLTAKKLLPELEAAEVQRRGDSFCEELKPTGDIGVALARQAAALSVRAERCIEHENAALTARVRRAEADFVPPEGCSEAEAAQLRAEAGKLALFDPSPEAVLARKYEAEARRGFLRALKELRQHEKAVKAAETAELDEINEELLASFSQADEIDAEFDAMHFSPEESAGLRSVSPGGLGDFAALKSRVDVPITIGRRR